jgi:hypothetical protein
MAESQPETRPPSMVLDTGIAEEQEKQDPVVLFDI